MWFVYILRCRDGTIYTGVTKDVKKRLADHRAGRGSRYVRARGAEKILHQEKFKSKSRALRREAEIKRWPRSKKFQLVSL